jgi:hypothetical protein
VSDIAFRKGEYTVRSGNAVVKVRIPRDVKVSEMGAFKPILETKRGK